MICSSFAATTNELHVPFHVDRRARAGIVTTFLCASTDSSQKMISCSWTSSIRLLSWLAGRLQFKKPCGVVVEPVLLINLWIHEGDWCVDVSSLAVSTNLSCSWFYLYIKFYVYIGSDSSQFDRPCGVVVEPVFLICGCTKSTMCWWSIIFELEQNYMYRVT